MTLKEKINYEFQCFFLDQMRTSKENIFAHSGEIETKKKLLGELLFIAGNIDEATENFLMPQNNLLESAYCFWQDVRQKNKTEDIQETVKDWLEFLIHKGCCLQK